MSSLNLNREINGAQKTQIVDSNGIVAKFSGNAPSVPLFQSANVHFNVINRHLASVPVTRLDTTLDVNVSPGDTTLPVASTINAVIGDHVMISQSGFCEPKYLQIVTVNAGVSIVVNHPIDKAYTAGAIVQEFDLDMQTIAGSLASPISFKLQPPSSEIWNITRMMVTLTTPMQPTDDLFGSLGALTNGIYLRQNKSTGFETICLWQSNGDMRDDMFDVTYSTKAGPSAFGVSGRFSFIKNDVVVQLNGANGDFLEALVQDDITGLGKMHLNAQGHIHKD